MFWEMIPVCFHNTVYSQYVDILMFKYVVHILTSLFESLPRCVRYNHCPHFPTLLAFSCPHCVSLSVRQSCSSHAVNRLCISTHDTLNTHLCIFIASGTTRMKEMQYVALERFSGVLCRSEYAVGTSRCLCSCSAL